MQAITTSGTILAAKYDGGILLASDNTISYGSMFRYNNVSHFVEVTPKVVLGGTGEFADFQQIVEFVKRQILQAQCKHNGEYLTPSEIHSYIKRMMYNRRSQLKPWATRVVVAGINPDNTLFLATTNPYGTSYEDDVISTGFGRYLQGLQITSVANGEKDKVREGMRQVFQTVFARHCQANGKVEFIDLTKDGIVREEPIRINPNWEIVEATWDE